MALLFGIDTQIGTYCLELLIAHNAYKKIIVFSNKELELAHEKVTLEVVNFDRIEQWSNRIQGNDLFYCTTSFLQKSNSSIATDTSSIKNIIPIAKAAASNEVNQLILLSSQGADKEALLPSSKLKGQIEDIVKELHFWAIHIFRPTLLVGQLSENRWGEKIASWLEEFLDQMTGGLVSRYKPIEADAVAKAMISSAQKFVGGVHIYDIELLRQMARDFDKFE